MVNIRFLLLSALCVVFYMAPINAEEVSPLKNGYSNVTPESAALLRNGSATISQPVLLDEASLNQAMAEIDEIANLASGPVLNELVEPEVPEVPEENMMEEVALADTKSINSQPQFSDGLTGIWSAESQYAYCDCEKMKLGDRAARLFSTVSKTFFNTYKKTPITKKKKPAAKKSSTASKKPSAPAIKKAIPVVTKPAAANAPEPDKLKTTKKKEPSSSLSRKKAVVEKTVIAKPEEAVNTVLIQDDKKSIPKKLHAMPKVNTATPMTETQVGSDTTLPWPKNKNKNKNKNKKTTDGTPEEKNSVLVNTTKTPAPPTSEMEFKAYTAPSSDNTTKPAATTTSALDCDGEGDRLARGRLAWMECYYRMADN